MSDHLVTVQIGPEGTGGQDVSHPPGQMEAVIVRDPYGQVHVLPIWGEPGQARVEVLGAVPNTQVTVAYRIPE